MNSIRCMGRMQARFFLIGIRNYRRALLMSAAAAGYVAFGSQADVTFGFGLWLIMTMNTVVSLKTRERQEDWLQFYMAGNFSSTFIASLLPVFVIAVLVTASVTGLVVGAIASGLLGFEVHLEFTTILAIANAAWFYGNSQNVIMQVVSLDKVMTFKRLSTVLLIIVLKGLSDFQIPSGGMVALQVAVVVANVILAVPGSLLAYRHALAAVSARTIAERI